MDILTLLVVVPFLTVIGLMISRDNKQARLVAAVGMGIQFLQSINLLFAYLRERASGNDAEMVFTKSYVWFKQLNIHYDIGVDGISVAMMFLA